MAGNPAIPARPRRGCLSGCGTFLLILIVVAALRGLFVKPNAENPSGRTAPSGATPGTSTPNRSDVNAPRPNKTPAKGDRAQLVRATPLCFNDTPYRQGNAGEQFEVIEYHPETKKVYLLLHGADGKSLACNVPAEAVTIVASASQPAIPRPSTPLPRPPARYAIVRRWPIPNGGEGKVIVIPLADASESGMTALADQLRQDTAADRNAFVYIFDDQRAAQMRDRIENLTSAEEEFYDRHYMGNYFRNGNNGTHEMEMHPAGMNGPSRTINF